MSKNNKSLVIEAEGYENLPFEEKDCQNYICQTFLLLVQCIFPFYFKDYDLLTY